MARTDDRTDAVLSDPHMVVHSRGTMAKPVEVCVHRRDVCLSEIHGVRRRAAADGPGDVRIVARHPVPGDRVVV